MSLRDETVGELCDEMRGQNECYACRAFADRIEAAFKREVAAKDEMTRIAVISARAGFDERLAAKDAEIARMKKALKPVMEYDFGDYQPPWKTLEVEGEFMKGCVRTRDGYPLSVVDDIAFGFDAFLEMANAIGEAQRVMSEGGAK